jgi:DNA helicase II / ATP-dependent DNA helicase PcrA
MDYIDDPVNVSAQQREAVLHAGRFFLTACPGSGKTRTVGVRLAYWSSVLDNELGRTRRVAATSYTNTAVREMTAAAERAGQPVSDPNFAGTLHRFLLRYVVRPFARPLMGCDGTPRVIATTTGRKFDEEQLTCRIRWTESVVPIWDFAWRADGSLTLTELPYELRGKIEVGPLAERLQPVAVKAKLALARRGLLSMSDVLYWAMRALEDEEVATTVAARFDELIVDEVQDTSDVQQQCIRLLHDAGLRSLVYVGDMQQAIYGFAHADPVELESLISSTVDSTLELNENWRSSQAICDVTHHFSGRSEPDRAVGQYKDAGHPPELIFYGENEAQTAVDAFVQRLEIVDIAPSEATVLCRSIATTQRLRGASHVTLQGGLRTLVVAAAAARNERLLERETVQDVERLVMSLIDPDYDLDTMPADEHLNLRVRVMKMLETLPDFDIACKNWAKQAREALTSLLSELADTATSPGTRVKTPPGAGELSLAEIVGQPDATPTIRTIHSVKGESHAATLLIAVDSDYMSPNWTSWLGAGDPEEVRVAYVALTRAQRFSALALPDTCLPEVVDEYLRRGFVHGDHTSTG